MIDSDRTAILAILSRWSRHWQASSHLHQQKANIEAQIAQAATGMVNAEAGLKIFGFDVSQDGVWAHLNALFANDLQAFMSSEDTQNQRQWAAKPDAQFFQEFEQLLGSDDKKKPPMPTIREIALMRLREVGPAGLRAKTIREYIQTTYGVECHEKTVGMTLYRLSNERLVRRNGHVWFINDAQESKTPGVSAPGVVDEGR
jgi:hypothetical protein